MRKTDFVRDLLKESIDLNKKLLGSLFHIARSSMLYLSQLEIRDKSIEDILVAVHEEHPWYGHRRIGWELGFSMKKARRLMKKFGITAKQRKRKNFIKPKDQKQEDMHGKIIGGSAFGSRIMNYLARLCPLAPNIVWRSDFTHIIYKGIHLYLATILDDYTKEIVGYAMSYHHTKEFVLSSIQDAITKNGWIIPEYFHSDQWSEYTSYIVLEFLRMNHISISMSSKWSPWQNWAQESYYGKLKLELWETKEYECMEALILAIHRQISYYNTKRLHTTLRDTPRWFREKYEEKQEFMEQKMKESNEWKK